VAVSSFADPCLRSFLTCAGAKLLRQEAYHVRSSESGIEYWLSCQAKPWNQHMEDHQSQNVSEASEGENQERVK